MIYNGTGWGRRKLWKTFYMECLLTLEKVFIFTAEDRRILFGRGYPARRGMGCWEQSKSMLWWWMPPDKGGVLKETWKHKL